MSISIKNVKGYRHFAFCALTVSALCALSLFVYPELLPDKSFADEPITPTPNITIGNSGALDLIIDPGEFDHTTK